MSPETSTSKIQKRRERRTGARYDLEQPAGGVQRVVEAVVAVGEEHVAAHLAGQLGALLFHLGFDQRVPCLPHDPVAAAFADIVVQRLRAFHFSDKRRARLAR